MISVPHWGNVYVASPWDGFDTAHQTAYRTGFNWFVHAGYVHQIQDEDTTSRIGTVEHVLGPKQEGNHAPIFRGRTAVPKGP